MDKIILRKRVNAVSAALTTTITCPRSQNNETFVYGPEMVPGWLPCGQISRLGPFLVCKRSFIVSLFRHFAIWDSLTSYKLLNSKSNLRQSRRLPSRTPPTQPECAIQAQLLSSKIGWRFSDDKNTLCVRSSRGYFFSNFWWNEVQL